MKQDKLKHIELICTGPLATDYQKELWKRYEEGDIGEFELGFLFIKLRNEKRRKNFNWNNLNDHEKN